MKILMQEIKRNAYTFITKTLSKFMLIHSLLEYFYTLNQTFPKKAKKASKKLKNRIVIRKIFIYYKPKIFLL